jgi:hypothetical protein
MTQSETLESNARADAIVRTMPLLLAWLLIALVLGLSGALGSPSGPPIGLGLAIALPLLTYWLDGRRGHPLFRGIARLDAPTLAVLQTFRVLGLVFIVAWWRGELPAGFALPAGIGDVLVGLAAPFVAVAVARRGVGARGLFIAWNVFGLVDLIVAVSSGITHSSGPLGLFRSGPSTDAMALYPFSLIPTFLVPLAVMLHARSLKVYSTAPASSGASVSPRSPLAASAGAGPS